MAELKAAGRLIPNLGVLVNSIPLLEAQASSEIENIVTTTDQMFLFDGASEGEKATSTQSQRQSWTVYIGSKVVLHPALALAYAQHHAIFASKWELT